MYKCGLTQNRKKFEIGKQVYLRLQPYRQSLVAYRRSLKLAPCFYGPFTILGKVGEAAYELDLPLDAPNPSCLSCLTAKAQAELCLFRSAETSSGRCQSCPQAWTRGSPWPPCLTEEQPVWHQAFGSLGRPDRWWCHLGRVLWSDERLPTPCGQGALKEGGIVMAEPRKGKAWSLGKKRVARN